MLRTRRRNHAKGETAIRTSTPLAAPVGPGGGGPGGPRDRNDRDRGRTREQYRVNHRIRVPEVRVLLDDGTQLGILSRDEALKAAEERGLDLVEITARANPPVCRIMDYGRFKYQESKKQKVAKRHASAMELKEIKFRPKTEAHDMEFKVKHVRRFLEEGNKCRLVIVFRGREIVHPNTGVKVLDRVVQATDDIAMVEVRPALEGKRMIMILGPKAGVVKRAAELRKASAAAPAPVSAADLARLDEAEDAEEDEAPAPAAARPAAAAPTAARPAPKSSAPA